MTLATILINWGGLGLCSGLLGASVGMLMGAGPFAKIRVPAVLATFLFVVGMTGTLVFGKQNLLQATLSFFTGG